MIGRPSLSTRSSAQSSSMNSEYRNRKGSSDISMWLIPSQQRYGMEFGRPTFMLVQDLEMGFEKIVKIVHDRGAQSTVSSIEAIAKASKEHILQNTDLSAEKAEMITRFSKDPKLYLSSKIS